MSPIVVEQHRSHGSISFV
jgi:hypothetical protein